MNKLLSTFSLTISLVALLFMGQFSQSFAKDVEGVVNVNTASASELALLPGIGKAKAEKMIALRKEQLFKTIEDLKAVKGIGAKRLESMKDHVVFSGQTTAKKVANQKSKKSSAKVSSNQKPQS